MLDLCLLGTGGMMPLPNRFITSLLAKYNGSSLLIDCGEGTQIAMKKFGHSFNPVDIILITHFHGDHIAGLPGFLLTMGNADRTEDVLIVGPKGIERIVNSLRVIAPDLPFKIVFKELQQEEETFEYKGYVIDAFLVNHKVTCYGYNIRILRAGKFDAEAARRLDIPLKFWHNLQKGETIADEEKVYTPDMVMGPERKGIKVTYCTDTRPMERISEKAKEADLFICEGMYGEDDKISKAKENKHMTMYEAAELAKKANVEEMWLTHYSPSLVRPEDYIGKVKNIFPSAKAAKDGYSKTIKFID